MKKLMTTAMALAIAVPTIAAAQDRGHRQDHREHRREHRDYQRDHRQAHREGFGDRQDHREWHGEQRRDHREFHSEHPGTRHDHRDGSRNRSWGGQSWGAYSQPGYYSYPTRRYYAQPSYGYGYAQPGYGYGYAQPGYGYGYGSGYGDYQQQRFYRGQILAPQYRRYVWRDYNRYGYPPPPYGHAYYRTDTGDIILAVIATGLILSVLAGNW